MVLSVAALLATLAAAGLTQGEPAPPPARAELPQPSAPPASEGRITARMERARLDLSNGLVDEAVAAALAAQADYAANFAGNEAVCEALVSRTYAFGRELDERGHQAAYDTVFDGLRQDVGCCEPTGPKDKCHVEFKLPSLESMPLAPRPSRRSRRR